MSRSSSAPPTRSPPSTRPARTTTARSRSRPRSSRTWSTPTTTAPRSSPDLAETAEFTSPTEYTVTLPEGLKWANGNDLTSADVKFSFDRNIAIADPNGASSLLYNLDSVETPDETTVVFNLKAENDQVFPSILTSFPGAIVDDEVFAADALTPDEEIVDANAFGGPYAITSWDFNKTVEFTPNENYQGLLDAPVNDGVILSYFAESSNLKLAVQEGDVDVAYRSLSSTDVEDLSGNDERPGRQRPRRRDPLHRVQLQHAAVRRDDARGR